MPAAFSVQAATRSLAGWRPWLLKPRRAHADGDEARWTARTSVCDSTCGHKLASYETVVHSTPTLHIVRGSYLFKSAAARARAAAPGCTAPRRRSGMSRNDRTGSHQVYAVHARSTLEDGAMPSLTPLLRQRCAVVTRRARGHAHEGEAREQPTQHPRRQVGYTAAQVCHVPAVSLSGVRR